MTIPFRAAGKYKVPWAVLQEKKHVQVLVGGSGQGSRYWWHLNWAWEARDLWLRKNMGRTPSGFKEFV